MTQRKGSPTSPPAAWVSLLVENQQLLSRVRMLWRRGKVPYRPLVPEHLDIDKLSDNDWIEFELPETHFEWSPEAAESPADRLDEIHQIVEELWDIAARWTRSRGQWCDFQLVGFDDDGEELFAVGRRLKIEDDDDARLAPGPQRPHHRARADGRVWRRRTRRQRCWAVIDSCSVDLDCA